MGDLVEELQSDIEKDIRADAVENVSEKLSNFEKMSKANLMKQEKKLLLSFADSKGLLKSLTDSQKERLTRKELADLIKPVATKTSANKKQEAAESVNELELYKDAIITALSGDSARLDAIAQKNVFSFIAETTNAGEEQSEQTKKIIRVSKFVLSLGYLGVKFTGGLTTWKDRIKTVFTKLKNKVGTKKNV